MGYIQINDGKMDEAGKLVEELVKYVKTKEAGTKTYRAFKVEGKHNTNKIYFYEEYEDQAAFKTHQENLIHFTPRFQPLITKGGYQINKVIEL